MSDIRYCDSCNKPLEAAAFTRGRAIERENLVVCGTCVRLEAEGYALPISPSGEGKEQFKAYFANLHESEIRQIQEETKPIKASTDTPKAEVDEAGTEPIEELPSLKVVGADGKALSARLRQNAAGELVLELEGNPPAKPRDTEPTSRVSQAKGDVRLPARSSISRAALSKRLEIETQAARSGRGFNMTAAMLFLVVVLSGLGFSIYITVTTQADARNQGQQGNQLAQNTNPPAYNTQPPAYNGAGNQDVGKTSEENTRPNKTGTTKEPIEAPLRFPVAIDGKTRERMIDQEKMIASPIILKLKADDLETRLTGLSDAIREISVECGPFIMPMIRAEDPAERQLVCEALGFLMVSDARPALERVKGDAKEKLYVRLAAGRALSRLDLRSHLQDLEGWSTKELEDLQRVLKRKGEKGNSLAIVERALKARRAKASKDEE